MAFSELFKQKSKELSDNKPIQEGKNADVAELWNIVATLKARVTSLELDFEAMRDKVLRKSEQKAQSKSRFAVINR